MANPKVKVYCSKEVCITQHEVMARVWMCLSIVRE